MLFEITYRTSPDAQAGEARFKRTGGLPPAGVKILGRWQSLDASSGRTLCETDDPAALSQWCREWAEVITLTARPLADEQAVSEVQA